MSCAGAVRRLRREFESLCLSRNPQFVVRLAEANFLEWHFLLHSFPADTPYHGGCYRGRLLFPNGYPHAPPAIVLVTPNGRLETGCKLCLSMTDFHPETWNPAWTVETILVGLLSFFLSETEMGFGALNEPLERRRQLAGASHTFNAADPEFCSVFPDFLAACENQAAAVELDSRDSCHSSAEQECWICREVTNEPLVFPCSCRGSMSGVHASCVEHWVHHHRRAGGTSERPRCSVCRVPYVGQDVQPGFVSFASKKLSSFMKRVAHSALLAMLLLGFQDSCRGPEGAMPRPARLVVGTIFCVVCLHKLVVLAVSLPQHRAPPHDLRIRRFHVADPHRLSNHVAESLTILAVLGLWWLRGELPLLAFLPMAAAALGLGCRLCSQNPSLGCLFQVLAEVLGPILATIALVVSSLRRMQRQPRRLFHWLHPLSAGPHILVAFVAVVLCLRCTSNLPVLSLWALHALLLGALTLQRPQWRRGLSWWYAVQLGTLSFCVANVLCDFPQGAGQPDHTGLVVLEASSAWLGVICAAALAANWSLCVRQYRSWQRRHSVFTLSAPRSTRIVPLELPV